MKFIEIQFKLPSGEVLSKIGFLFIDTRIGTTTNINCAHHTAYNNSKYNYTKYETSTGVSNDTKSKSLLNWAHRTYQKKFNINFST